MSVACSRLLDSAEDAKVKGTRKVGRRGKGKSFLPFYFRVRAFSIQGARLSQSLGQASMFVIGAGGGVLCHNSYSAVLLVHLCTHPLCFWRLTNLTVALKNK